MLSPKHCLHFSAFLSSVHHPPLLLNHYLATWHNSPPDLPFRPLLFLLYPLNLTPARRALSQDPCAVRIWSPPSLHASSRKVSVFPLFLPRSGPKLPLHRPTPSYYTFNYPSDPVKHTPHPTQHYTYTFSFENPQGVDNYDNSIENIECPDDWTNYFACDVKYPPI